MQTLSFFFKINKVIFMEINEREKHPMIKCTSYSRGQVRFERDLCFMIMLTTQSFSFTACSYPKVVLPMSILLQYTSYVTYTHIYLIRLFQKVPRGQAVVEPPFKVRLFPSLKIANARMEKKVYTWSHARFHVTYTIEI